MMNKTSLVRGLCLMALAGCALSTAACEERVVVRRPQPVVVVRPAPAVVYTQPVVQERVIVR